MDELSDTGPNKTNTLKFAMLYMQLVYCWTWS